MWKMAGPFGSQNDGQLIKSQIVRFVMIKYSNLQLHFLIKRNYIEVLSREWFSQKYYDKLNWQ